MKSVVPFLIPVMLGISHCRSTEVIYKDISSQAKDNYWVDNNTLQITVESLPEKVEKPVSLLQREQCLKARENINTKAESLYPSLKKLKVQPSIKFEMYVELGGCRLIVHYTADNLRKKL